MASNKGAERLESLKKQGLSQQEMLNRLDAIVDAESAQPEGKRDRELIQACIDLQWFLTTGEHYTSEKEVARQKLDSALHEREKQTANGQGHPAKTLAAVFCLVVAAIMLPMAGQTLLSRKWIEGQTVDGGEVYQLNGQEVELAMLKKAIADRADEDIEIKTSDFSALSGLIEVQSIHPERLPSGWICEEYCYKRIDSVVYYVERYTREKDEIEYRCVVFPDADSVVGGLEQNETGRTILIGSKKVYLTENIDTLTATWNKNLENYTVHGKYTLDELKEFVESIKDEEN